MSRISYTPNEDQLRAINATSKGIRIVAPAGSGKTDTLVLRTIHLIEEKRVDPKRILILSFDNSARQAFEQKFRRFAPGVPLPEVTTINKFGSGLLKGHFPSANGSLGQNGNLRTEFDRNCSQIEVLHWDGRYRKVTDVFDALKQQGYAVEDLKRRKADARQWLRSYVLQLPGAGESLDSSDIWELDEVPDPSEQYVSDTESIFAAYAAYETRMRDEGWVDYADQILRPLTELRRHEAIRDRVRSNYDEVVVDECQDINRLEALMIRYLLNAETTLVVSGDDDQALYEFRQSNSIYLREPSRYFARSFETIDLNVNYRTPQEVLLPALELIGHNNDRLPKSPQSGVHHQGAIETIRESTESTLARAVFNRVRELLDGKDTTLGGVVPEDIGILCGRNQNVTAYRNGLTRMGLKWAEVPRVDSGSQTPAGVMVDTMLKAKGRQWKVVILPDATDAVIPGPHSMRTGSIEAERRKFYVAMTRASHHLVVGYTSREAMDVPSRTSDGELVGTNGASRFVFEAGILSDLIRDSEPVSIISSSAGLREAVSESPASVPEVFAERFSGEVTGPESAGARNSMSIVSGENRGRSDQQTKHVVPARASSLRHDWDVREDERRALEGAAAKLHGNDHNRDHRYATLLAFPVIVQFVKRNIAISETQGSNRIDAFVAFNMALEQGVVNSNWGDAIHRWRITRNRLIKEADVSVNAWDKAIVEEMVRDAPLLFQYIAKIRDSRQKTVGNSLSESSVTRSQAAQAKLKSPSPSARVTLEKSTIAESGTPRTTANTAPAMSNPPSNVVPVAFQPTANYLFTNPDRLARIAELADIVQAGLPHPRTNKPVKSLKFTIANFREEMLILQLHLLLRDVRFHIAKIYRWTASPVFSKLSMRELSYRHHAISGAIGHRLQPLNDESEALLIEILSGIIAVRFPENRADALLSTFNDAANVQNGNYPTGFKIRAYTPNKPK